MVEGRGLDPLKALGVNIKRRIDGRGYATVELFAHEHAIPKGTLSKILNGKVDPKVSTLYRIAEALGVAVPELFRLESPPETWVMEKPKPGYRARKRKRRE